MATTHVCDLVQLKERDSRSKVRKEIKGHSQGKRQCAVIVVLARWKVAPKDCLVQP